MKPPILRDFPDHIYTERFLIRAPQYGDGAAVNEAIRESFDMLNKWMDWAARIPSLEESECRSREASILFAERKVLQMSIWDRDNLSFIGMSGFSNIDWSVPKFEIGYWVRQSCQGKGYITEAVHGLTKFGFASLRAERLEIRCDARNERSVAVARRAGYELEGRLRRHMRTPQGDLRDTLVFARFP